jgi:hypothetical protein
VTPKAQATEAKLNPTKGKKISEKAKQRVRRMFQAMYLMKEQYQKAHIPFNKKAVLTARKRLGLWLSGTVLA